MYDETCLVFAARYAHSRYTAAAMVVVSTVIARWDELSPSTRDQIIRESKNEASCNLDDWQRLWDMEDRG